MLKEFGQQVRMPTTIGQDNMSTIALTNSRHFNARTKHVALRYHHVGDQVKEGVVKVEYLPTADMTADALTKPLAAGPHNKHKAVMLGREICNWWQGVVKKRSSELNAATATDRWSTEATASAGRKDGRAVSQGRNYWLSLEKEFKNLM